LYVAKGLLLRYRVAAFLVFTSVAFSDETTFEPSAIIDEYVAASIAQQSKLTGASMEVEIAAEVPKLHKSGRLRGLRRISALGRITYDALRFEGDRSIKNDVIARYLTAEAEALKSGPADLGVTPANYKFKYKGLVEKEGRKVYAFHVSPRKKKVGLFVGELWLDPETHLAIRESGRMVKSPSVFVKKIEFVREYEILGGIAIPRRIETSVDTRLVGKAILTVAFTSFSLGEQARAVLTGGL
jgi:hypothetical protein